MKIEREIKVEVHSPETLRKSLKELGFNRKQRIFERNYVLDTQNRELHSKKQLLRIRYEKDLETEKTSWVLTFKSPKTDENKYKTMYEYETRVKDGKVLLQIFKNLGYDIFWIYEKIRETWIKNNLTILVDTLPKIGVFIEIEDSPENIENIKSILNIKEEDVITDNYFVLTVKKLGKLENLLFEKFKKD